ncbi:MAG: 50S ribosomal protein L19 [Candidatus Absconditabacteria bacterium]
MNFDRIKTLQEKNNVSLLDVQAGMYLEIHEKIGEGDSNRVWRFKGLVIKVKKPQNADGSFTIRGSVAGVDVEKIYPLSFTKFDKVTLLDDYKIRKSKLYYIREKIGKDARMKSKISSDKRNTSILAK